MDVNEQYKHNLIRRYKAELKQVRIENISRVEDAKLKAKLNFQRDYREYLSAMSDMFIKECEENFISKDSNFFRLVRVFNWFAGDLIRNGHSSDSVIHTARLKELVNNIEQSKK
tara:strand:- start:126 stop:467 length:342 start_codon:yes stop_codon:yes gene_type:complete